MQSAQPNDIVNRPRGLVTWGTKHGGTEGIARMIGDTLRSEGLDVDVAPASTTLLTGSYDVVVIGTWLVGFLKSTMPWPEVPSKTEQARS